MSNPPKILDAVDHTCAWQQMYGEVAKIVSRNWNKKGLDIFFSQSTSVFFLIHQSSKGTEQERGEYRYE